MARRGEMGGLWLPPIKLMDGFQARIADVETGREIPLSESAEMVAYPHANRFTYGQVLEHIEVDRFQFGPDGSPGVVVQYRFRNSSDRARRLSFLWFVKTDLRPGWYADRLEIRDGRDVVDWRPRDGVFIARDVDNPWYSVWGAAPGADVRRIEHPSPISTNGRGVTVGSSHNVTVGAHGTSTLTFVVAGSTTSESDAIKVYNDLFEAP